MSLLELSVGLGIFALFLVLLLFLARNVFLLEARARQSQLLAVRLDTIRRTLVDAIASSTGQGVWRAEVGYGTGSPCGGSSLTVAIPAAGADVLRLPGEASFPVAGQAQQDQGGQTTSWTFCAEPTNTSLVPARGGYTWTEGSGGPGSLAVESLQVLAATDQGLSPPTGFPLGEVAVPPDSQAPWRPLRCGILLDFFVFSAAAIGQDATVQEVREWVPVGLGNGCRHASVSAGASAARSSS